YTLSEVTLKLLDQIQEPVYIDVFLEGKFPLEFKKLQLETRQLLEEYRTYNSNVYFQFVNPLDNEAGEEENVQFMFEYGMKPVSVTVNDKGKQVQELVFPWAMVNQHEKAARIQLLKNMMGANTEEKVI